MKELITIMNANYLRTFCSLAVCASSIPLAACVGMSPTEAIAQSPPPTLKIHADQKGIEISPELYGVFFEEINHSGDGGLYAEMIRNRDFEEMPGKAGGVPGWTLKAAAGSAGKLTLEMENPYSPNNPSSLKVSGLSTGDAIRNEGYWGVSIKKQARYRLSFNVRTASATSNQKIAVRLKGKSGTVFAESVQSGFSTKWKHFQVELLSKGDDPEADLEFRFQRA